MGAVKNILKTLIFPFAFSGGYLVFLFTKKTPKVSYDALRFLFVLSNGRFNDFMSNIIKLFKKSKNNGETAEGVLGSVDKERLTTIVDSIRKDGFFVFDVSLKEELIEQLVEVGRTTKAKVLDLSQKHIRYSEEKYVFDEQNPKSPRYQFDPREISQEESVQSLIFDDSLRVIAAEYLESSPILDTVAMWWSAPFNQKGTSQSAQMFHFDMDRFKFIKFFFYLTDVHEDNGPHCYIQSSHRRIPSNVRKDRRMTDEELKQYYSDDRFKEFVGKKGKILAVDTRGLHKGKPLVKDSRLLLQVQFSNSLFGADYKPIPLKSASEKVATKIQENKRTYQLFQN